MLIWLTVWPMTDVQINRCLFLALNVNPEGEKMEFSIHITVNKDLRVFKKNLDNLAFVTSSCCLTFYLYIRLIWHLID